MAENKLVDINKIPSPTWSWLKMNKAGFPLLSAYENFLPEVRNADGVEFKESFSSDSADFDQFVSGTSFDFGDEFIPVEITVPENKKVSIPVVLNYDFAGGLNAYTGQVIRAEKNSEVTVIIVSDSDRNAEGQQLLETKVYASEGAKVNIVKVQLFGESFIQLDETSSFADENAEVILKHVVLGGKETYVGAGTVLKGYKSVFNSELAYYCSNEQILDMNYVVPHYGRKSECQMYVRGTVTDRAKKTYRGTIDFKQGCAGSVGEEQEETLILSPYVVNNSIPVILCDEEDVSGEHGASIGRLGDDVLFYMQSRGIGKAEAEKVLARAKVQAVVSKINDEKVAERTENFMNEIFGDE